MISRFTYTYDSNGYILVKDYDEFGGLHTRITYTYDQVSGLNTVTYYQLWDEIGSNWESYTKSEIIYDNEDRLSQRAFFESDDNGAQWVPSYNESWTYTSFGESVTSILLVRTVKQEFMTQDNFWS